MVLSHTKNCQTSFIPLSHIRKICVEKTHLLCKMYSHIFFQVDFSNDFH